MKILVNDECVCELNDTQKKAIMDYIHADEFDADMKRRVNYIIMHLYEQCLKRLREEWMPKLKELAIESVPLNDDAFAEFVFAQKNYKDRKAREVEEKENKELENNV